MNQVKLSRVESILNHVELSRIKFSRVKSNLNFESSRVESRVKFESSRVELESN